MLLLNAFSLNMLPAGCRGAELQVARLDLARAKAIIIEDGIESAVGHADTARVLSSLLGVEIPVARATVVLEPGHSAIVAQYVGLRLPEGATSLPDGARIDWFGVEHVIK